MTPRSTKPPERLFLLDGMALAYRAYYSLIARPLINSKGENTSAIYGFVTTLMKILDDEKPEHIAVVFDTKEPTFRHERFPAYKATRQKMPEDMAAQLDTLKEVVRAFNTPLVELPGFEADDIIGTLARQAEHQGIEAYLVSADKDLMQLVSPLIRIYRPGRSGGDVEILAEPEVKHKFGVAPSQVTDVLALSGDKSDNVPGVPGIGDKTAIPLIQQFGTLEALYAHVDEIPQKGVREKLASNRESAFLSKELVTIKTDVPLRIDIHGLRAASPDTGALVRLFDDLEFKSLATRLREAAVHPAQPAQPEGAAAFKPPAGPTGDITRNEHAYHCITTADDLDALCARLKQAPWIVIDTETTSTDPLRASLVGLSFCLREREAYYIPVKPEPQAGGEQLFAHAVPGAIPLTGPQGLEAGSVLRKLKPILEDPAIGKIGQNIKYDMLVLLSHGIVLEGIRHDTMVASYILRPDGQHSLDALAMEAFRYKMVSFEELVGKGKTQRPITDVPLQEISDYSSEDADLTMRIHAWQLPRLRTEGVLPLCETAEFPLIPVLARMEFAGISLDVRYLEGMAQDLERQLAGLVSDIHRLAGEPFNINSTQQLGEILFTRLKLPPVKRTKTGYSTDVSVLEALHGRHPIIEHLLEYRQLAKLKSTYVDALPSLINPRTGRIHTSFNQTIAATGRLSSSDPNLQNIPIRTEIGRAIRKAFIPGGPDTVLLSADYSQIELRVMAHISGDDGLVEAFRNNEDIHSTTAAKVFGVPAGDVSRDMRRKAKEVNFGIMYGIGPFGLANRLEVTQGEAREIINRYFERFPKVKQYINDTIDTARRTGAVSTLLGRRRYLPDINSRNQNIRGNAERQAINMPIQGTAADMIKIAMIALDGELQRRRLASRMLLQVHDELVFEVPQREIALMETLVVEKMQNALPLNVPLNVDVGSGKDWLEAH